MALSSVSVVTASLLLRNFRKEVLAGSPAAAAAPRRSWAPAAAATACVAAVARSLGAGSERARREGRPPQSGYARVEQVDEEAGAGPLDACGDEALEEAARGGWSRAGSAGGELEMAGRGGRAH